MSLTDLRPGITFSVVLPVYQQPSSTRMILECLQEQKDAPTFEVIVCDDGSSPEIFLACQEVVRNAAAPIYWVWQQDRGFRVAASRNNGIRMASGRHLLFLDGDMVPEENLLAGHYALHTRPGLAVLGTRSWRSLELASTSKPEGAAAIWRLLRGTQAVEETLLQREETSRKRYKHILKRGGQWRLIMSNNLSVERRTEVYFDEEFAAWGMEDAELGFRLLQKHGFELVYAEKDLVCYHLQATLNNPLLGGSHENIAGTLRNLVYFSEKWPELRTLKNHSLLSRLELDPATDRWSLIPGEVASDEQPDRYDQVCDWLHRNGQFPTQASKQPE